MEYEKAKAGVRPWYEELPQRSLEEGRAKKILLVDDAAVDLHSFPGDVACIHTDARSPTCHRCISRPI